VVIAYIKTGVAPAVAAAATPAAPTAGSAPDAKKNTQIAALPIGGRVKLDVWYDRLELIKSKPIGTVAEREKMPFEVTPFMPYLTRFNADTSKPANASSAETKPPETASIPATDPKPADPTKP